MLSVFPIGHARGHREGRGTKPSSLPPRPVSVSSASTPEATMAAAETVFDVLHPPCETEDNPDGSNDARPITHWYGMRTRHSESGSASTSMRVVAASVLAGILVAGTGCTRTTSKPKPNSGHGKSGVVMKITPAKPEFAAGEPIVLSIELTNGEEGPCRVSRVPEGALSLVSLTRENEAVAPGFGYGSYIDGMASFLRSNLVPLAPGASLFMEIKSDRDNAMEKRLVLETSTLDALDETALMYWPVDARGRYSLSARYVPSVPDAPTDLCRASGEPVQVAFTVLGG